MALTTSGLPGRTTSPTHLLPAAATGLTLTSRPPDICTTIAVTSGRTIPNTASQTGGPALPRDDAGAPPPRRRTGRPDRSLAPGHAGPRTRAASPVLRRATGSRLTGFPSHVAVHGPGPTASRVPGPQPVPAGDGQAGPGHGQRDCWPAVRCPGCWQAARRPVLQRRPLSPRAGGNGTGLFGL